MTKQSEDVSFSTKSQGYKIIYHLTHNSVLGLFLEDGNVTTRARSPPDITYFVKDKMWCI